MSACREALPTWERVAREAQIAGEPPVSVAHLLNGRGLLDRRRGGEGEPWTADAIRHAMNAAGRYRGPRWASGWWGVPAAALAAHRAPDFARVALSLADAGHHLGEVAEALNAIGYDARGAIWTAASAKALIASARALARDHAAAAEAKRLAEATPGPRRAGAPK